MIDELPKLRFTFDEWKQRTSSFGVTRSIELEAVDRWLRDYIARPNWGDLRLLRRALETWKAKYGADDAWMKSRRNDNGSYIVAELNAELSGKGDSDAAFGVPSMMAADLAQARKGLLFLFGHTQRHVDTYKVITGGAFEFTGTGLELLGSLVDSAAEATGALGKALGFAGDKAGELALEADRKRAGMPDKKVLLEREKKVEQWRTVSSEKLNTAPASVPLTPEQSRLSKAFQEMLDSKAIKSFKGKPGELWEGYGGKILRGICDLAAKKLLTDSVIGIVGGTLGLVPALVKLVEDAFLISANWLSKRRVPILPGAPTAIVDSLERAMGMNVGADLYTSLKGGASFGLTFVSAGLGSTIMSFVCSVVELLVKTAWRLWELRALGIFLAEAKDKLAHCQSTQFHAHPFAYNKWFREHASQAPIIAALAMNSSLCHNMNFLQMFQDGDVITEAQYQGAMKNYIRVKEFSSKYIEDSGYLLTSDNEIVEQWLKPGLRPSEDATWRRMVLKPALDFMGG